MDDVTLQLSGGEFRAEESWVYVWSGPDGAVLHVGATGLPLAVRTWLHLNDERPEVGRIRANHPEALSGEVTVRGFAIGPALDRQEVRRCLAELLGRSDDDAGSDPSGSAGTAMSEAARIRDALASEPGGPAAPPTRADER